ncbi:MAG: response regulator transcription factor [Alphaproteobacteria bacterium]|nr:response regulator transcription factor [Alphaproteobacteria bacterium]
MTAKRILIADDHPLFHEALKGVVGEIFPDDCQYLCTVNVSETLRALDQRDFDLILLDLNLPGAEGFSCLVSVRKRQPSVPVVIVSSTDDVMIVRESFSYGAMGYLPKSSSQQVMENAIRLVISGSIYIPTEALGSFGGLAVGAQETGGSRAPRALKDNGGMAALTPRQLAVLALLAEGKANKIIAYELGISEITVKAHVSAILRKLGVSNRLQAVLVCRDMAGKS